jgi:hypothetical protein
MDKEKIRILAKMVDAISDHWCRDFCQALGFNPGVSDLSDTKIWMTDKYNWHLTTIENRYAYMKYMYKTVRFRIKEESLAYKNGKRSNQDIIFSIEKNSERNLLIMSELSRKTPAAIAKETGEYGCRRNVARKIAKLKVEHGLPH